MKTPRLLFLLVVTTSVLLTTSVASAALRAGAATSNVTPPLGVSINGGMTDRRATHVHDELHARCLVLDDGTTRVAIAVVDSCMLPRPLVDEAKRLVEARTKIPPTHVLIAATHTHNAPTAAAAFQSAPDADYARFLSTRVADGVQRAANNLAPAGVKWGVGKAPEQVFNRRWRMKPGTIPPDPFGNATDQVQMNPPAQSPNLLEPAGPTDPDVWVLDVRTREGSPVARVANYALHYVGGYPGDHVSADYFGMFARSYERDHAHPDPPPVAMLSNGASGNINNVDFRRRTALRQPYQQARAVAEQVHGVAEAVTQSDGAWRDDVKVNARTAPLTLGVRKPTAEEVRKADVIVAGAAGRELRSLPEIYAGETLALKDYPDQVELVLQVIRIGDTVICAIPCEVFVEVGLKLKAKSPIKPLALFALANGYNGYLPTPEHHELGGYETWRAKSSYLEKGASPKVVAKLLELLAEISR